LGMVNAKVFIAESSDNNSEEGKEAEKFKYYHKI